MKRKRLILRATSILFGCLLWGSILYAQEPNDEKPKPAARSVSWLSWVGQQGDNGAQDAGNDWRPDTTPLTGLQAPSLGSPSLRHSYWEPALEYGGMTQSQPLGTGGSGDWSTNNYLGGSLSLLKASRRSILALNYSGGGIITTQSGQDNGWYQQTAVGQSIQWQRWQWQWSDEFSYLPQAQFGFGAGTGLSFAGIGGSLGPGGPGMVTPGQSVFAATGPRYSNVAMIQGTYLLSPRQSITVGGWDALLHFTKSGNIDSANYLGSFGYNYTLTKADSVGVMYRFSAYHFNGQPQAYGDSSVSVVYGRKITQRLAFQAYAGPEFINYRVPVGGQTSQVSAMVSANLVYALKHTSVSASYYHGLSAGSGVFLGSETDQITFGAGRQITRAWSADANLGFASNRTLIGSSNPAYASYNNAFAGGGVNRPIGRNVDFSVAYTAYNERPNQNGCTQVNCNASHTQHTVTLFLQWHTRPFVLE